jgi:hypothetical protein
MNRMTDTIHTSPRRRWAWPVAAGLGLVSISAALALGPERPAHASEAARFERGCIGTYLVLEEASGAQTLWTFHADRTLVASSTGEKFFAFSGQQGSWRPAGESGANAVLLTFDWDDTGTLEGIGRVDIEARAEDRHCDTIRGEFEGRIFLPGDDPLDLAGTEPLYGDTIIGRRVSVP